jgi:hypothetical protein
MELSSEIAFLNWLQTVQRRYLLFVPQILWPWVPSNKI